MTNPYKTNDFAGSGTDDSGGFSANHAKPSGWKSYSGITF